MTDYYKCNGAGMQSILDKMKEIQTYLEDAYAYGEEVYKSVESQALLSWSGASRDVFYAFMDLLIQYHAAFLKDEEGAVICAVEELEKHQTNLENFYTDFCEYQSMGEIV